MARTCSRAARRILARRRGRRRRGRRAGRCRSTRAPRGASGQRSRCSRWRMSAQVSKGSTKPGEIDRRAPSSRATPCPRSARPGTPGWRRSARGRPSPASAGRARRARARRAARRRARRRARRGRSRRRRAASSARTARRSQNDSKASAGGAQARAVDELLPVGLGRPAGQAADVDQRLVLVAAADRPPGRRTPAPSTCGGSPPPAGDRRSVLEAMEEGEAHAAPTEHLVERREDDVAHAGVHAPEERAAIGEEGAHHAAQRLTGGDARRLRSPSW